jgi:PAS domain S-box-containing protein
MKQLDLAFVERAYDNRLDPVAAFSDDLRLRYWNPPMETLSAVPRERAVGAGLFDLFPNERDGRAAKLVRAALSGDGVFSEPPFFAARDPARAHEYEWMVAPLLHQGNVNGGVLVARSSLARGGIEHRLAETEQRFRAMADSSPVLLWMSGRDALCNFFNSTWLAFSGRTLDQELGVGWSEGIYPEDFERCMTTYTRAFSAREAFEMEYRLRRHDGEYRWILDRGAPRFTPAGEFAGFIGSCVDITDRIRAEQETRELAEDLQRANSYMEQLLYATSHDLREPIRMVLAFLERLDQRLGEGLDREARTSSASRGRCDADARGRRRAGLPARAPDPPGDHRDDVDALSCAGSRRALAGDRADSRADRDRSRRTSGDARSPRVQNPLANALKSRRGSS